MELPVRTPEQRAADLEKAAEVRKARAKVKQLLKQGSVTLPAVLKDAATDDTIAKMKVLALIQAMPGVGKVKATEIMGRHRDRGEPPRRRARIEPAAATRGRVRRVVSCPASHVCHCGVTGGTQVGNDRATQAPMTAT